MDVSDWTIAQRMRLPDWCFGSRETYIAHGGVASPDTYNWGISDNALPDPACIWEFVILLGASDYAYNKVRIGLSDTVPTSKEEMDATDNIFPDFGDKATTPPGINCGIIPGMFFWISLRRGLATGGKKLVMEAKRHASGTILIADIILVISTLPTDMAGWMAHSKV